MFDGIDIAALVDGLRCENFLAEGTGLAAFDKTAEGHARIGGANAEVAVDVAVAEGLAFADEIGVIGKDLFGPFDLRFIAFDFESVAIKQAGA